MHARLQPNLCTLFLAGTTREPSTVRDLCNSRRPVQSGKQITTQDADSGIEKNCFYIPSCPAYVKQNISPGGALKMQCIIPGSLPFLCETPGHLIHPVILQHHNQPHPCHPTHLRTISLSGRGSIPICFVYCTYGSKAARGKRNTSFPSSAP